MALLTLRTHAKKLQLVCHADKSVLACDFFLKSGRETFIDFHHAAALAVGDLHSKQLQVTILCTFGKPSFQMDLTHA